MPHLLELDDQEGRPIVFFSEKLNDARKNYSTYDVDFYAIVQAFQHWRHYLISQEFILFTDHEALRYVNSQIMLNTRHAKWVSFLQQYTFILKQKFGKHNKVIDALSRRVLLLTTMKNQVVGFQRIKDMYESDANFENIMQQYKSAVEGQSHAIFQKYFPQNG